MTEPLRLRVTEFDEFRSRDRDNMVKPIADALQGIVYVDDRQVVSLQAEWKDLNGSYRVRHMSKQVAAAFVAGDAFIWVRVWVGDKAGELG